MQLLAAGMALRLNFRYRIYSAWFFVSAALCVDAILRLSSMFEMFTVRDSNVSWLTWAACASLLSSILFAAGISFIEPFFKEMAKSQASLRAEHKRLTSKVHETEEELRLAQRIQRQLLPSQVPQLEHVEVYGKSVPAEWTSGDYFDFIELADGSTAMIVADVSGHGLGPALLMSSTRASFRGLAATTSDVGELLTSGNRAVADSVSDRDFVTAMVIKYCPVASTLYYAGAGHVGYLLNEAGDWERLDAEAPPLGILRDISVSSRERTKVRRGDLVVVVTDGILETENAAGEMFGETLLQQTIAKHRGESCQDIVEKLLDRTQSYAGHKPQQDDNTALVLKITG